VSAQFLSFDEAWRKFGSGGPLMEFVYLVTQGNSLYERLSEQVARLEDDARTGTLRSNELALLRLVSVASAFDARLHVKPLVDHLGLTAPKRTFQYFEKEYLIRLNDDGSLVYGLHPIRSAMLCDLLTDPTLTPWVESAQACLPVIHQPDGEVFLLHAFSRRQEDRTPLLQTLHAQQTDQWVAWAGITRALIWLGVREYVDTNRELIREAFADAGEGWDFHLDQDIADAMPGGSEELWHTLSSMASEEWRQRLEARHARQTNKQQIFIRAQQWLASRTQKPAPPITDADWTAMAEALFWAGRLRISWPLADWLNDVPSDAMIDTLPLQALGDVILGLSKGYPDLFGTWIMTHRHRIAGRFRQETRTIVLEDDGEKITAHFVVEIEPSPTMQSVLDTRVRATKNRFHEEAMMRIDLMRRLFPDRELYASQGYGHKIGPSSLDFDDTQKMGIASKYLPPLWLTSVNAMFRGLAEREFRPHTWPEYVQLICLLRHGVVVALEQLSAGIERYFRRQQYVSGRDSIVDADDWERYSRRLRHPPLLPSCVLDEWGMVDEHTRGSMSLEMHERALISKNGIALQAYKPFLDAFRNYTTSLSNFFEQSIHVMAVNPWLGRHAMDGEAIARLVEHAEQMGLRTNQAPNSTYNLAEAVKALPQFQREFRRLLGHVVLDTELTQVERQERQSFTEAWYLWYFFGAHPRRVVSNPPSLIGQATDIVKRIRTSLRRQLRALSAREVQVSITSEKALWDFEPALWLTINGEDAVAVYQMLEAIIQAMRQAVRTVPETELRRYVLNFHWPYVVVVPLVRGKSLNAAAWRLNLSVLLWEDELRWWNYVQAQIPADAMTQLAISTWQDTRLDPAFKFLGSTTELSLYAAHIGDFLNMPQLDEEGEAQLQAYLGQISGPLGTTFQSSIDAFSVIARTFNELSSEEQTQRPHLFAAVQALVDMRANLFPADDFRGQLQMTVADIAEWAERLKRACEYAYLVYLFWVSDVLAIHDMNART